MDTLQNILLQGQPQPGRCEVCGEPLTMGGKIMGQNFNVARPCKCQRQANAAQREREQQHEAQRLLRERQRECFSTQALTACTFQNDDGGTKVMQAARRYADNFKEMYAQNMGLLLYGPVGSGKSYVAAAIANAVLQQGRRAVMTTFAEAVQTMQGAFGQQHEYVERLARVSLLVIDDLGAERGSDYMMEQVYTIIDTRYRARRPLIVTTNLPIEEIKSPAQLAYARIYDRVLEMCHPVKVTGPSRRREALKKQYAERNKLLGLE